MRIDVINGEVINKKEVSIHDFIFNGLNYNYKENTVCIYLLNAETNKKNITITYLNVIAFTMIACDFWGSSPHILDWEFVKGEEQLLTNNIIETKESHKYTYSKIDNAKRYMETIITFSSGDTLTIVCEYIELAG